MKKYIFSIAILSVIPSVAFASWWNPFSWFKKKTTAPQVQQVNVATQPTNTTNTPKEDSKAQIEELQKQIRENHKQILRDLKKDVESTGYIYGRIIA